jgi:integrase
VSRKRQDVRVWAVQDRRSSARNQQSWIVRWRVEGKLFSRSFKTRALAERFRSTLIVAHDDGEAFDEHGGEPVSWAPASSDIQVHMWARRWLAEQWREWQPRTRSSAVEALMKLVPLVVASTAPTPPETIRTYLQGSLAPDVEIDSSDECEKWLVKWCLSLAELDREVLAEVDRALGIALDGRTLAPSTAGRFRKVSRSCIRRAVELGLLATDPWPPVPRGRSTRKSVRTKRAIDIRALPEPETMRRAIEAIATHQSGSRTYQVMTAVAYYAGLRPSEVVMLRPRSLSLPLAGWGRIDVTEADVSYDEVGEPKTGPRSVPIPPVLVATLRAWLDVHEFAPDDLIFRTRNNRMPTRSNWSRAWHRALATIDHPPLRVYDCRHAAATTWLEAGVPLGDVARRLGHSVETLVSTYVGSLAGDETSSNTRIEQRLNAES